LELSEKMQNQQFERDPRRRQEIRMRPAADAIYRSVFSDAIEIERFDHGESFILDKHFAIDLQITLPCGMILLGQEKFLSHKYASFGSVTVEYEQNQHTGEPGDWFRLSPQIYFVGYTTKDKAGFSPWVLLNWPSIVMATHNGEIEWHDNKNKDGRARASFRYCFMRHIPSEYIIAASI
jgi:hypothetical protein